MNLRVLLVLVLVLLILGAEARKKKKKKNRNKNKQGKKNSKKSNFIVGGLPVPDSVMAQYSSTAWLEHTTSNSTDKMICGATWIGARYALTVKYCVNSIANADLQVHLRDRKRSSTSDQPCEGSVGVVNRFLDTSTSNTDGTFGSNLVILELSADLGASCNLPKLMDCSTDAWATTTTLVTTKLAGWGSTSAGSGKEDILRAVNMKALQGSNTECTTQFSFIKSHHLCAKAYSTWSAYKGPCYGDGGSPLYRSQYVVGVEEYQPGGCPSSAKWSAYIAISHVCEFIMDTIGRDLTDVSSGWLSWNGATVPAGGGNVDGLLVCNPNNQPCGVGQDAICIEGDIDNPQSSNYCTTPAAQNAGCDTWPNMLPIITTLDRVLGLFCTEPTAGGTCSRCCDVRARYKCYNGISTNILGC